MTSTAVAQTEGLAARVGTQALTLLSLPLNAAIMQALAEAPKPLADLRREVDSPPQSTMRSYMRSLSQAGVVEKRRYDEFPGSVEYQLSDGGHDLVKVAEVLGAWLARSPDGRAAFGSGAARGAIKAFVDGWLTNIVRALADRPCSLTELDAIIPTVTYPSLERRLGAMRHDGLVEPLSSESRRGTAYGASDWLRMAMAPLAAAARWEQRHLGEEVPPATTEDAEAAFLLALPLLRLPRDLSGSCRLEVQIGGQERREVAGVIASVRAGKVDTCETTLEGQADCWAQGTAGAWLATVVERDKGSLAIGGNTNLATGLVGALHGALFGVPA